MKVLLLFQERILLDSLSCLLRDVEPARFQVVGRSDDGLEGLTLAREHAPDVALVGTRLLSQNGLEVVRHLTALQPPVRTLVMASDALVDPIPEIMAAGAGGCITRQVDAAELVRALQTVADGDTYLCSLAAEVMVRVAVNGDEDDTDPVYVLLTPREREVLQLLAEGWSGREAADRLHISSKTVDTHRRSLMAKLDAESVAELVKHAIRAGLTNLDP